MTRRVGAGVPAPLAVRLDGRQLDQRIGQTFLLVTTGEDGWPHVAMLSVGEVVAMATGELRLALWPGSATTANLGRSRLALLMAVVPPATYYLRLRCHSAGGASVQGRSLALFTAEVEEAREDVVAYAEVEHGIGFRLVDVDQTLAAWREAVAAMRAAGG